jgi:hypothetical protein
MSMNDDWRLQVDFHDSRHIQPLLDRLEARELQHDLSAAFQDRVIVSRDGGRVFLYAGSKDQADRVRDLVLTIARQHGWNLDAELRRWHPAAEDWEDPGKPLPDEDAARLAEHQTLMAKEREEAEQRGYPEFEVRVDLPSRHDAVRFAERLGEEGLPAVHRWKFLLVGAADEDSAKELAARIEDEAPTGSSVKVEGTWTAAYAERPPNPFAVLGGLAG